MKILGLLIIGFVLFSPVAHAKGGGGGHSSGHVSTSHISSRPSTPSRPSAPRPSVAPKPPAPKPISTKPTAATPKVTKATPTTVAGKTYAKTGNVVGAGYQPKFKGVTPPAGSVVYYRESSFWDWFPMYYILTHDDHRDAVVQTSTTTPTGVKTTSTPVKEEGVDTMYVINWILTILIGLGLIAGIMWLINKSSKKSYV